jgi:hypothetical protein
VAADAVWLIDVTPAQVFADYARLLGQVVAPCDGVRLLGAIRRPEPWGAVWPWQLEAALRWMRRPVALAGPLPEVCRPVAAAYAARWPAAPHAAVVLAPADPLALLAHASHHVAGEWIVVDATTVWLAGDGAPAVLDHCLAGREPRALAMLVARLVGLDVGSLAGALPPLRALGGAAPQRLLQIAASLRPDRCPAPADRTALRRWLAASRWGRLYRRYERACLR